MWKVNTPFSPLPDFRYATLTTAAASTAQNSSLCLLNWDYCSARVLLSCTPGKKCPSLEKIGPVCNSCWAHFLCCPFSQRSHLCSTYYPMLEKVCLKYFVQYLSSSSRKNQIPIFSWLEASLWYTLNTHWDLNYWIRTFLKAISEKE